MARTPLGQTLVVSGLAEALPVTADATTSRAVLDNDAARVVLFAFDQDQELTEHTAALPVVLQVLRGRILLEVAGGTHDLAAGDLCYLAPREPHSLVATKPSLVSLVMVRPGGGTQPPGAPVAS